MVNLIDKSSLPVVASFIRLYGPALREFFPDSDANISFHNLPESENQFRDILVRLGKKIFISPEEVGRLGLSNPEIFAALAHELGHILYNADAFAPDNEQRADTLAARLGLGSQMIAVIEKIIASRRFRHLTSELVRRIQFLQLVG
ncbi:MAG: hypothetical protein HDS24_01855 [Bacteroides sp.]|nr:hypothetical protein [Bacteroidales bacterium]MBD5290805.1 hypothetical protein [Bacteroides sp.]